jgi:alpha-tubulin suppressor-like RCC1 family protein
MKSLVRIALVCAALSLLAASNAAADSGPISAGGQFACYVSGAGAVNCWGEGDDGQLGDGRWNGNYNPHPVLGLSGPVSAVSTGENYACAIQNGAAQCWGALSVDDKKLDGTAPAARAHAVDGLSAGVTDVTNGEDFSCAVVSGNAACWGLNTLGQIGNGSDDDAPTPTRVIGLPEGAVTEVSAGHAHACAVVSGVVECWGDNRLGEIGNGRTQAREYDPQQVSGIAGGASFVGAGSDFSCALVSGAVFCWGNNTRGQLGNGSTTASTTPVAVSGLGSGVTALSVGFYHACAIQAGRAKCWGYNEYHGLGDRTGKTIIRTTPFAVRGVPGNLSAISAGDIESCTIVAAKPLCWGGGFAPIPTITSAPKSTRMTSKIKLKFKGVTEAFSLNVNYAVNGKAHSYLYGVAVKKVSKSFSFKLPAQLRKDVKFDLKYKPHARITILVTPYLGTGKARTKTIRLKL